jgi:hypothetical protein
MRYAYGSQPLWCTLPVPPQAREVPPCELCGSARVFEFQLMPALLYIASTHLPPCYKQSSVLHASSAQESCHHTANTQSSPAVAAANMLDEPGINFGVAAVWVCPSSCSPRGEGTR